jgi:3-isopropylmalate dehydrogenase
MKSYKIVVLPGDGIGPEVISEARRVLEAACSLFGFHCDIAEGLIGQSALDATGKMLPPETLRLAREADAVLLGPVGGTRWEHPTGINHPKQAVMKLRGWLGTYATLRPIKTYEALADISPLKPEVRPFDMLLVHDHSSGLPYGTPRGMEQQGDETLARNTQLYSSREVERVARVAFEAAIERQGRVLSVDQSKTLETGELWRDTVERVSLDYPGVRCERIDHDNFAFELVRNPGRFDVVLSEVTIGELFGVMAAGLTGTYAFHPAAYIGESASIFQPRHGAAPDIAGKGIANPIAAIRAVAMMMDLAFREEQEAAAVVIEAAVEEVLNTGFLPAEICASGATSRTTREIGDAVLAAIQRIVTAEPTLRTLDRGGVEFLAAEPDAQERPGEDDGDRPDEDDAEDAAADTGV